MFKDSASLLFSLPLSRGHTRHVFHLRFVPVMFPVLILLFPRVCTCLLDFFVFVVVYL
jgi:hypothetical protein